MLHIYIYIYIYIYVYIDAFILPTPSNITNFEGMPVKLNCTVNYKTSAQSKYKLVWIKERAFITGDEYSFESSEFNSKTNTQNHYLTIHKANPGAFTCKLISTNSKVIDMKTQHVVTESKHTSHHVIIIVNMYDLSL